MLSLLKGYTPIRDGRQEPIPQWFEGLPKFRKEPTLFVVHFTGGEEPANTRFRKLVSRGLSVHFHIDALGTIRQWAPLDRQCAHAGDVNNFSIGVEIQNRGLAPPRPKAPDRMAYEDVARGKPCKFLDFYPAQYAAFLDLADCLTKQVPSIRRKVPLVKKGEIKVIKPDAFSLAELRRGDFRGVLGHCHVPSVSRKVDPGPRILNALAAHWRLL